MANRLATDGLEADLTLVLDVPARTGLARLEARPGSHDRIEGEGEAFMARVAEAYRLLAEREPGAVRVDGTLSVDLVHAEIVRLVAARFPETFIKSAG
jgi:dTMP kinase